MKPAEIIRMRLFNQKIASADMKNPEDVVSYLGAMQAQEFAMAKWAIGLRMQKVKEKHIDDAFNSGKILRTHVLRPTWHFVTPEDIRIFLAVSKDRVQAFNAMMYKRENLDLKIFVKSTDIIARALEGGKYLTRNALQSELQKKKIAAERERLAYVMMYAELEGVICSGPRSGKQFTYALVAEKCPAQKNINRKEALFTVTEKYFRTRGPATVHDFSWWSGLTITEAKSAAAMLPASFIREKNDGKELIFLPQHQPPAKLQSTFLLPDYDEYGISYKDRSLILNNAVDTSELRGNNPVFTHMIVIGGKIAGIWKINNKNSDVIISPYGKLNTTQQAALKKAVKKYQAFFAG